MSYSGRPPCGPCDGGRFRFAIIYGTETWRRNLLSARRQLIAVSVSPIDEVVLIQMVINAKRSLMTVEFEPRRARETAKLHVEGRAAGYGYGSFVSIRSSCRNRSKKSLYRRTLPSVRLQCRTTGSRWSTVQGNAGAQLTI